MVYKGLDIYYKCVESRDLYRLLWSQQDRLRDTPLYLIQKSTNPRCKQNKNKLSTFCEPMQRVPRFQTGAFFINNSPNVCGGGVCGMCVGFVWGWVCGCGWAGGCGRGGVCRYVDVSSNYSFLVLPICTKFHTFQTTTMTKLFCLFAWFVEFCFFVTHNCDLAS